MTTDTEALRAQFERRMNLRGWSEANMRRDGLDYSSTQITEAWHAFQAGYAAAKAETAAAVAAEWERATDVLAALIPEWDGQEAVDGGDLIRMLIDAIRAGAKEPSDG